MQTGKYAIKSNATAHGGGIELQAHYSIRCAAADAAGHMGNNSKTGIYRLLNEYW